MGNKIMEQRYSMMINGLEDASLVASILIKNGYKVLVSQIGQETLNSPMRCTVSIMEEKEQEEDKPYSSNSFYGF